MKNANKGMLTGQWHFLEGYPWSDLSHVGSIPIIPPNYLGKMSEEGVTFKRNLES